MRCPYCARDDTRVVDSRDAENALRRRRECLGCAKRFTTYERVETTNLLVVKKDGTREQYSREKVKLGVTRSCEKLPISNDRIEAAVARVESKLAESKKGEVSSKQVGELVMNELKRLNKVAYIRFAAVYREFADIEDFQAELARLLNKAKSKTTTSVKGKKRR